METNSATMQKTRCARAKNGELRMENLQSKKKGKFSQKVVKKLSTTANIQRKLWLGTREEETTPKNIYWKWKYKFLFTKQILNYILRQGLPPMYLSCLYICCAFGSFVFVLVLILQETDSKTQVESNAFRRKTMRLLFGVHFLWLAKMYWNHVFGE